MAVLTCSLWTESCWCSSPKGELCRKGGFLLEKRPLLHISPFRATFPFRRKCRVYVLRAGMVVAALGNERKDLEGRTVVVVGLGASGRAAAQLALARGATVIGVDSNPNVVPLEKDLGIKGLKTELVRTELGPFNGQTLQEASLLVLSPGVPLSQPQVAAALDKGVLALSEPAFASEVIPPSVKIAAITGTNGKSTVTTFCGQLTKAAGVRTFVGGNLGTPLSVAALECLQFPANDPPYEAAVVEVSSYQMELPGSFRPKVAVVLNLTPDHLERHGDMETYGAMKCRLFSLMDPSDLAIIPQSDPLLRSLALAAGGRGTRGWLGGLPGVQLDSKAERAIISVPTSGNEARLQLSTLQTVGTHNAHNAGAAALVAMALDARVTEQVVQDAMPSLAPPPHRMQPVCNNVRGVLWVNDSKATNVDATLAGIQGMGTRKAVILLGGMAKAGKVGQGLGFGRLVPALAHHRAVITFGASGKVIAEELRAAGVSIPCENTEKMGDALARANEIAQSGDVVLLSPACASFDEFTDFTHRGRVFGELARQLSA